MCLAVTKFVLRKINFGVWFIQTFLQKMHQIWQKKQNLAKENESISHSFTKETKPSKKIHQIRSNWDHAVEARLSRGEIEQHGAAIDDRRGVIVRLELGLWSPAKSLLPLSLRSGFSLSLSRSLSLLVRWGVWFSGSLSLLSVKGNGLKVKWICKMISGSNKANFGQTEMNFRKFYFP